jgi:MYXO-CTERM domain-containing protein
MKASRSRRSALFRRPRRLALCAALAAAGLTAVALHGRAVACGGLFCDGPPPNPFTPLPVAQNGENVVFAITKDPAGGAPTIDAHIQILYTGDAAKFSWVVPVEAVPTLSTGTDRLFSTLASLTQPRYNANYQTTGTCIPDPNDFGVPGANGGFATGAAGSTGAGGSTGGGVTVAFQGGVGPYDAAVIQSTDPTALKTWLSTNGYVVSDAAGALIDAYVRENKYFVALKLMNGMGISAIQPIVLTFRGTEPCVPLRLTAIAANPDMPVLVWVLADKRVVPRGFYEIEIDEARIDWWNGGSAYFGPKGLVGQAADEAGGDAFIAEYAGPSQIAQGAVFLNGQINLDSLKAAQTPPTYVNLLASMGLANDPLILGLLQKYIPMPAAVTAMNVTPAQFYGSISTYWAQYAFPAFDLAGLTDAISTSIVTPRMNAQMMIDAHPYLTRLNTYISPPEMNQDAFFFESTNLPDISNVHTATIEQMCGNQNYMRCNAPQRLDLPDGRMIWLSKGSTASTCQYAPIQPMLDGLPASSVAWQRDDMGPDMAVVDNRAKILAGIDAHNKTFPTEQQLFPIPSSGGGGAGASGGGGTAGSSFGVAGAGGSLAGPGGGGSSAPHISGGGGGCSCSVSDGSGSLAAIVLAAAFAFRPRRRRRDCAED